MTNQSSDIQPAFRARNVLVRGGRLTRFRGQVASIAPGLSVVATTVTLSTGGVDQAMAQVAGCAPHPTLSKTVTCDAGEYNDGITYTNTGPDRLTLLLDDPAGITVGGSGVRMDVPWGHEGDISVQIKTRVNVTTIGVSGVFANSTGNAHAAALMTEGSITTTGQAAGGLGARAIGGDGNATALMIEGNVKTSGDASTGLWAGTNGGGDALARMDGGKITTVGEILAEGIHAWVSGTDSQTTATARMTAGDVSTRGAGSHGLFATNSSTGIGDTLARIDGGTVTTVGEQAAGLLAHIQYVEGKGTATARMTGEATVNTSGNGAHGLWALNPGLGDTLARMDGGTITTDGSDAHGLWAELDRDNDVAAENTETSEVRVINGTVLTKGEAANALFATHNGSGAAIVRALGNTTITTVGEASHGLAASAYGANKAIVELGAGAVVRVYGENAYGLHAEDGAGFDVDVAGSVTGGTGNGTAIHTLSDVGGTIDIASTGEVMAGGSGIAIWDGGAGAVDIFSAGTIKGDIHLGAGNDILTLTGGSFTGNLDAGEGDDTVTISATTVYDSSKILDGGDGNDELTLHGQTLTTMENFLNWESVTLNDTTLNLDGMDRLDMGLSIEAGAVFSASGRGGDMTIAGDVINRGTSVLSVQDGNTGDVITIEGDYTGSGASVFALDTVLEGAGFASDTLVIEGNTSGETMLSLAGLDSAGAEVTELEIDVISIGGASDGTFRLMDGNYVTPDGEHAVIAGAYLYRLAETDSGWALSARSESGEISWGPSLPIHDSYGAALLEFNALSALRERGSSQDFRSLAWGGNAAGQDTGSPLWIQVGTEQITSSEENSTTGVARDSSLWEMEVGADVVLSESGAGLFVGGLMLSYGTGSTSVSSRFGDGSIDTTGLGLGLSATWYDRRGFYVDGQASLASYTSDLSSDSLGTLTEGNSGTGFGLSLEAGQRLDLGSRLSVIPQAQLSLSSVGFDDFTSKAVAKERVSLEEAVSQQLRLGLEFAAQDQGASDVYGIVNLYHDFGAGSEVTAAGRTLTSENEAWALGVGVGGRYALTDRVDLFGDVAYATGLSNAGDTSALSANAGLKVVF